MKHLRHWQRQALAQITPRGEAAYAIMGLRGRAKNYAGRYARSLENAVKAHNAGLASNSPLPGDAIVVSGHVGPRGGWGYRLLVA